MSVDAMEFLIIVVGSVLILGVVIELTRRWLQHVDNKRDQDVLDLWKHQQRRKEQK